MPSLEEIIKDEIRQSGPMTFARFMELALYHPELGYYGSGRGRIGKSGDFYTSPHVGPVYGMLIAEACISLKGALGAGPCRFVEMGAGEGHLARDFLEHLRVRRGEEYEGFEYLIVERSPGMRARQEETLGDLKGKVAWYGSVDEVPGPLTGVFFSNELVDAFPFHRVRRVDDSITEIYADIEDGRLADRQDVISTPLLARHFNRLGIRLPPGLTTEVNLLAPVWMKSVADKLARGFVITVDYGYPACEYYSARHMHGTLMCYHRHSASEKPYVHIGEQDITAHVDFTTLALAGLDAGLSPVLFTDQTSFLTGALELLERTMSGGGASQEDLEKMGRGLKVLLHPQWMGGAYRSLVQVKGVDPAGIFDGVRGRVEDLFEKGDPHSFRFA